MNTKRIKEIEKAIKKLNEEKAALESKEQTGLEYIRKLEKLYLGQSILVNNEENGYYLIKSVTSIETDGDENIVFHGPGLQWDYEGQQINFDRDDIMAESFYSDPEYYKIEDFVSVIDFDEELLKITGLIKEELE